MNSQCGKAVRIQVNYLFIRTNTYPQAVLSRLTYDTREWENSEFTPTNTRVIDRVLHTVIMSFQSVAWWISPQFTGPITIEYKI